MYFLDKGLDYINNFTLKMVSPGTIEDTERDEQLNNRLNQASDILSMIDGKTDENGIFDTVLWILENFLNLSDIAEILRNHSVTEDETNSFDVTSDDGGFDSRSSPMGDGGMDFGGPPSMEFSPDFSEEPSSEPEITPEA